MNALASAKPPFANDGILKPAQRIGTVSSVLDLHMVKGLPSLDGRVLLRLEACLSPRLLSFGIFTEVSADGWFDIVQRLPDTGPCALQRKTKINTRRKLKSTQHPFSLKNSVQI